MRILLMITAIAMGGCTTTNVNITPSTLAGVTSTTSTATTASTGT